MLDKVLTLFNYFYLALFIFANLLIKIVIKLTVLLIIFSNLFSKQSNIFLLNSEQQTNSLYQLTFNLAFYIKKQMTALEPFFGKYQRYVTIFIMLCYQLLIVPLGFICIYAVIFLDLEILTPLLIVCAIQYPFRKSESFINFVQKYVKPTFYFKKFTRILQQKITQNEKTLYGFHPHSIFSYSILLNMNHNQPDIPDFIGLGSRFGFNAPILGMILRLWGCSTVHNQNLRSIMEEGKNIGLVPGGYQQASLTTPNQMRLFLSKRKGFVKYALRYGYTMRPVICFGQNKAFDTLDIFSSMKLFLNRFKVPTAFFFNKKWLFFIDPEIEITTIIGKGITRQSTDNNTQPTIEQVQKYHSLYVQEVIRVYNKYKHLNDNKPLVIM